LKENIKKKTHIDALDEELWLHMSSLSMGDEIKTNKRMGSENLFASSGDVTKMPKGKSSIPTANLEIPISKKMEFIPAHLESNTDFSNLNYHTNTFVTEFKDSIEPTTSNGNRKSKKISKITS